ncbi:MAG: tRNA pseudouridine synthase A [Candidatus Parvarchaeota archaeon]
MFVLREEATSEKYGVYPERRDIKQRMDFGFVLLDKPSGIRSKTSAFIAKKILSPLGATKIGYSGTLV